MMFSKVLRSQSARLLRWLVPLCIAGTSYAADLQVSQYGVNPDPIAATAVGAFTVRVANNGVSPINNAVVTVAISDRYQVLNAAGNFPAYCSVSGPVGGQSLTCNLPSLLGGSGNSQTFTYKATATVIGTAATTATITASGNVDTNATNNAITITPTVRAAADLSVVKVASATSVIAGGSLQYTLTPHNAGPNTTGAVRVTDTLPPASDFTYQSATGSGWTCSLGGSVVTCNYSGGVPAAGADYPPITISGKVVKNTAGTISNIANAAITDPLVLDPDPSNDNSAIVVTNIAAGSDLRAIKSMPTTITVGQAASITLSIGNSGPQTAPVGTTITDVVSSSLSLGTMPAGCSKSGQTVTCTAGSLASGAQANFTIPVTGAAASGGTITNSAQITPPSGFGDPDLSNNSASVLFSVVPPHADLQLASKAKSPNPVAPGANITNTIVVRNSGPSVATYDAANPIRVTDTLSANETYVSAGAGWSCSSAGTVVSCQTTGSGTLTVGGTVSLTLITTAGAGVDATITNTACTGAAAGSSQNPPSSVSATGADCRAAGVRSTTEAADLSVVKDVSLSASGGWTKALAIADTDTTFFVRIRVSNAAGGNTARTVNVSDVLPNYITSGSFVTGVTQQSATAGTMSYNSGNGMVSWNVANLAAGQTQTLIIKVDRPFESGSFTNFASVFSPDTTETNNSNNADSATYTVAPLADMAVNSKTITPNPARVGVPATYIIGVVNNGANPADNVQVIDVIDPTRFEITGPATTTKAGGSCSVAASTGTVTCNLGQFVRTQLAQVSIPVLPKYPFGTATLASLPAVHTNVATVTTSTRDSNGGANPNAGNNFFTYNHTVNAPAFDLSVTKVETDPLNDDPIHFGETLNYDIRISNFGPSRTTDVVLTDLPAPPAGMTMTLSSVAINPTAANSGLSLQPAPNAACAASGANYVCKIDPANQAANYLDPGRQVIFRTVFTVGGPAPAVSTTFTNAAQVTSAEQPTWNGPGADTTTTNNRAVQTTTVRPTTDLEIVSKQRTGALLRNVSEPIEYTIRFRNNGPSGAAKIVISDVLPAGFVYAPAPAPSTAIPGGSAASVTALSCAGTTTIACTVTGDFPVGAANTVDLKINVKAQAPYSGALSPVDSTNTATISPALDAGGDPLSEDPTPGNDSQTAVVQIRPSTIAGTVYADNNGNSVIDGGEGINGVTLTLSGTDLYGNAITATATSSASGSYVFGALPPSDPAGYTIVETQPAAYYDLAETAGTSGGTANNATFGNTPAQNSIAAIVLPPSTNATGYLFQDHLKAVIVTPNDNPPAVNGGTGQADIVNTFANDTFNGAAINVALVNVTIVTPAANPKVTMDTATGEVSVAPGTAAGTYTIDYQLCDKADPLVCSTGRVTVVVTAPAIVATADTVSGVNGATGAADVLTALAADTLNGVAATTSTVTITLATGSTVPAGLAFDPSTGMTTVQPNTPAGTYTFNYQICEILNPANCAVASETIRVVSGPITAVNDSITGVNGATGAANVLNVLTGDTRNGVAATTATVAISLAPAASIPAGLTFDTTTGNISVTAGTPAGTYAFNYRICETINPTNCAIAQASVTVVAAAITAATDTAPPVNGASGGTGVISVLGNDTLNNNPAALPAVSLTVVTPAVPVGSAPVPVLNPATGLIDVPAGTPAGSYTITYRICETLNPTNCATATATIPVTAATIIAGNDSAGGINGIVGGSNILSALAADTLNGVAATTSSVTISLAPGAVVPAGLTFAPATGSTSVAPATPAGSYSFDYRICELINPTNCATATETVTVIAAPITAASDSVGGINGAAGGSNVLNVLAGDTLNGASATVTRVTIGLAPGTVVPSGLTFDASTGNISVGAATPAGIYSFDYRICERLNPTNCATATATVTVIASPIVAVSESATGINGGTGAANVLAVLAGDTLSGTPATTAGVTIGLAAGVTLPAGLAFDTATGNVSVNPGTPAGTFSFDYRICERLNPTNCATATETVTVVGGPIAATPDSATGINGASGATNLLNVLTGDTVSGASATSAAVTITIASGATVPAGLSFDPATGNVSVVPGTSAGTYAFDYTICERLNPTNCATSTASVTVIAAPIVAVNDSVVGINGGTGASNVVNAFGGDTLNGQPATPVTAVVTLSPGAVLPAGIMFDAATGNVSVSPNTSEGAYSFPYTICERLNPTNCATAAVSVTVLPPRGAVSGIVYSDFNSNRAHEGTETLRPNWAIEVVRNGAVVGTATTDANGFYTIGNLLSGPGYTVRFRNPANNVVYGTIAGATLPVNGTLANQDLPIDPSGVVYDSITRQPVAGAVVTLTDAGSAPIAATCFLDPSQARQVTGADGSYQFNIVTGSAAQCPASRTEYRLVVTPPAGYAPPQSTVLLPQTGPFNAGGRGSPAAVVPGPAAPQAGQVATYYLSFLLASGDGDVINNHIPLDPFLSRTALIVTKTSDKRTANLGDLVSYTITVRNVEAASRAGVTVVDILPPGFKYVTGTSRVNGIASEPLVDARELRWLNQTLAGNSSTTYQIVTVIGAGVTSGDRINTGVARGPANDDISNRGQAIVSIVPSAIFDCAEVIGKVFDDLNGDGYQQNGEPGVPAARVATVNGQLITTDQYGRYHITCAAVPDAQIGSNFVLKLDTRSIPEGYAPTADNPQSIRLTRGKISELNFGVQKARVVHIELDQRAFVAGTSQLLPDFAQRLAGLKSIKASRLVISLTYAAAPAETSTETDARLTEVKTRIAASFRDGWDGPPPVIEANMTFVPAAPGRE